MRYTDYLYEQILKNKKIVESKNLTKSQLTMLAEYAIAHGSEGSIEKANYLTSISGYNILKGIELARQSQEG